MEPTSTGSSPVPEEQAQPERAAEPARGRVAAGRRISYILRHDPASAGLTLEDGGWVSVDGLLHALSGTDTPLTRTQLDVLVFPDGKRRYAYDDSRTRIRALQGHSTDVDLGLVPSTPPAVLYHGTTEAALDPIIDQGQGLLPGSRQHVHLSASSDLARIVGDRRRGTTAVLGVDAAALAQQGHLFYVAENGVWLTAHVPAEHLTVPRATT